MAAQMTVFVDRTPYGATTPAMEEIRKSWDVLSRSDGKWANPRPIIDRRTR
jgi:hypothetical protein